MTRKQGKTWFDKMSDKLALTFYTFEKAMDQGNYIIFLCYGNERVFHECAYALLSLSRLYPQGDLNAQICIYTDNPGWFRAFKGCPLPLNYRELDSAKIKKWRGEIDFVHRVKIEVLKDFTKSKSGNILYTDTDVVFTHRIEKILHDIRAGKRYMHIMEGRISDKENPVFKKLNNYLESGDVKLNGKPMNNMSMWNAGVLGFNTEHSHVLDDVLAFTDKEYPKFRKHIVEQFAFSAYFQGPDNIKIASPCIFHYWNLKEAGQVLASFFSYFKNKNWDELVSYSSLIQLDNLMQQKVVFLSNRGISGILSGKKWAIAKQDWGELVKQL